MHLSCGRIPHGFRAVTMLRNSGCAKSARRFHTRELGRIEGAGHRGLSGWEHPAQTDHHPAHVARLPGGRATFRVSRSGRGSPPLKWISGGRVQVAPAGSRETPLPPLTSLPGSPGEACAKPPAGSQCDSVTGGRSRPRANRRNRRGHIPCAPGATAQGRRRERLFDALCGLRGRSRQRSTHSGSCRCPLRSAVTETRAQRTVTASQRADLTPSGQRSARLKRALFCSFR